MFNASDQPLAHQIRVHLQYLGHSIANDPVYSEERIWVRVSSRLILNNSYTLSQGPNLGKGGVDVIPCEQRAAPAPPPHLLSDNSPEALNLKPSDDTDSLIPLDLDGEGGDEKSRVKLLPRETGHDIGMGSPVPLSSETVEIITKLRNMKVCDLKYEWLRAALIEIRMKTRIGVAGEMSCFERRGHSHPKTSRVRPFLHRTDAKKGVPLFPKLPRHKKRHPLS